MAGVNFFVASGRGKGRGNTAATQRHEVDANRRHGNYGVKKGSRREAKNIGEAIVGDVCIEQGVRHYAIFLEGHGV